MANKTQEELYREFLAVSGQQTATIGDTAAMLSDVIAEFRDAQRNVPAAPSKTVTTTSTTPTDSGSTAGSIASMVLKSGFGLAPLIGGLASLFSDGDEEAPAPLVKYARPASIDFQAAERGGRMTSLEYDQTGMVRRYAEPRDGGGGRAPASGAAPQVTVNVQAMDSRSFMDRSNDIALAVRDAMLNLNSINDVVNEL